jgi:dodecin
MTPLAWFDLLIPGSRTDCEDNAMANHVYSVSEVVGSSPEGIEAAVNNAVAQAARTVRNLDWFEVQSVRGQIAEGAVAHWQVTVKLGFRLESSS